MLALPIFPASHPASIVGADELNFCVRDGNRWTLIAINTNSFGWALHPSFMSKLRRALTPWILAQFPALVNPSFSSAISRRHLIFEELVTRTGFEPMLKA